MAGSIGCDNGSMDSTWLPGVPYLVQIQKAELWLLQQPPPSNPVTDVLGNTDSRSHRKSPFITDGNGRDRWMLGTESESQDEAKPLVQVMAGGLGDLVFHTQSHQRGPFLHRKRQRLCCMGRALPRAVSCHTNAIYRSDIKWSTLLPFVGG